MPLPATDHTVALFLTWLSKDCKFSTINNYLHNFFGHEPSFRDSYLICMVLRGLKNILGNKTVMMQPFTVTQLRAM